MLQILWCFSHSVGRQGFRRRNFEIRLACRRAGQGTWCQPSATQELICSVAQAVKSRADWTCTSARLRRQKPKYQRMVIS
jgi:hypothetical protein